MADAFEKHLWALRRSQDGRIWSGLFFRHVAVITVLREATNLKGWEVYRAGYKSWLPLTSVLDEFVDIKKRLKAAPPGVPVLPRPRPKK